MQTAAETAGGPASLCSHPFTGELRTADGGATAVSWQLPDEVPIALQINSKPFAVMMASPADLRDFAVGLMLSEGLISNVAAIEAVLVLPVENGVTVDIAIAEARLAKSLPSPRTIEGRTGCGLCGVEDIADAIKPIRRCATPVSPSTAAMLKAARALPELQPMNRLNRSVHAAAFVSHQGDITLVREDVGRHNALDKLIGALAAAHTDPAGGFVFMTSRCSFELVQKAAMFGIGALVTVSAPTVLAMDLARGSGLFLAALGGGGVVVFNPSEA
ncbi:MAG: formate dehydrogenase accessory sulfurtransferase FdhD [Hyphomicrobium sp.]